MMNERFSRLQTGLGRVVSGNERPMASAPRGAATDDPVAPDEGDLVRRALAILAGEVDAWQQRSVPPADSAGCMR